VTRLFSLTTAVGHINPPDITTSSDYFSLGHFIQNTSETEKLVWIELYKSDRVADISLVQWLALTAADTVANILKLDIEVVKHIKEKQLLVKG
jgi:oxalate decarboxylase/phosphoglucose isomerase-like protein (cupin superfamily)